MRTREEQIEGLGNRIQRGCPNTVIARQLAERYVTEIEQRVRAGIGEDLELLAWFEENCSGAKSQWNEKQSLVEWQVKAGEWFPNLRTAIDKARGEDNA